MKRLVCLLRGHIPFFVLQSSATDVLGTYMTACQRCGRVYEQRVKRLW